MTWSIVSEFKTSGLISCPQPEPILPSENHEGHWSKNLLKRHVLRYHRKFAKMTIQRTCQNIESALSIGIPRNLCLASKPIAINICEIETLHLEVHWISGFRVQDIERKHDNSNGRDTCSFKVHLKTAGSYCLFPLLVWDSRNYPLESPILIVHTNLDRIAHRRLVINMFPWMIYWLLGREKIGRRSYMEWVSTIKERFDRKLIWVTKATFGER